jgi:hypothetical protein
VRRLSAATASLAISSAARERTRGCRCHHVRHGHEAPPSRRAREYPDASCPHGTTRTDAPIAITARPVPRGSVQSGFCEAADGGCGTRVHGGLAETFRFHVCTHAPLTLLEDLGTSVGPFASRGDAWPAPVGQDDAGPRNRQAAGAAYFDLESDRDRAKLTDIEDTLGRLSASWSCSTRSTACRSFSNPYAV